MANQIFEEHFVGKYDGVIPALLLPHGSLSGGKNVRKVSPRGGWKPRKGCTIHNTTALESGTAIKSLHQYTNPRDSGYHFIAQCNSKLTDATNDPPTAAGTTFGTDLGVTVGTTPGFSCQIKEDFFYADGSGRPITYGGATPYPIGFMVYDNSKTSYMDYTRVVSDKRTTEAIILGDSSDVFYVGSSEIAEGIIFDLTTVSTRTMVSKVYSWVDGAWEERTAGYSDGTLSSGKTLGQDGTMSWTRNATDSMSIIGGIMAYWYKVAPQQSGGNTTHVDETCGAFGSWTDGDGGDGTSLGVTFGNKSCWQLSAGTAGAANYAGREKDIGSYGDRVTVEISCYFETLGTLANDDAFYLTFNHDDVSLYICFASDGLYIYDGSSWNEVGTNLVVQDTWQTWGFDADLTTAASATVDVYLDTVLKSSDEDCSHTGTYTDGECKLYQMGDSVANTMTYIDYLQVGDGGDFTSDFWVKAKKVQVVRDAASMTNKWNGVYEYLGGCRLYNTLTGEYRESLGKISNESTSQYINVGDATTDDYLYMKTFEPATAFAIGAVVDHEGTDDSQVDLIEYWNGETWVSCGAVTDTTLDTAADTSFAQSGVISWDAAAISPKKRTFEGDQVPGYWYRMSWDATISYYDVRLYLILYAPFPETLPTYDGCVEFKGRLFLWGDPEYPNRLRYSAYGRPDCFSGSDSGYTDEFGGMDKVVCAIPFYNELLVFKKESIWLLEGHNPQTFGAGRIANTVGLASPKTAHVVEVGSPSMHQDEPMSIAIWQDVDGIYVLDGRKPRKASMPIDNYFNTESTDAIAAASIANRQAGVDPLNNEYHFLLPAGELVYNYATDEWYPPWERDIDIDTWVSLRGTDGRNYAYGGSSGGFVFRMENDTTDKNASNADVAITHSIKTRAIGIEGKPTTPVEFNVRKFWAKVKARSSGDIVTKSFKDMASSGTTEATPQAMSMISSGYAMAVPGITLKQYRCACFQIEFSEATADTEMEIWSMPYELEIVGELGGT